jgi:hypothetical protein
MKVSVGQRVWVPCEVKPGPFSDQRMVRVNSPVANSISEWFGFVAETALRTPVITGSTEVTGLVVGVVNDRYQAQVLGEPLSNTVFEDLVSRAEPIDSVKG